MTTARGFVEKTDLTADEKLTVAYFHLCHGIAQHTLASMFRVNPGRVNGAIMMIRASVEWPTSSQPPKHGSSTGAVAASFDEKLDRQIAEALHDGRPEGLQLEDQASSGPSHHSSVP